MELGLYSCLSSTLLPIFVVIKPFSLVKLSLIVSRLALKHPPTTLCFVGDNEVSGTFSSGFNICFMDFLSGEDPPSKRRFLSPVTGSSRNAGFSSNLCHAVLPESKFYLGTTRLLDVDISGSIGPFPSSPNVKPCEVVGTWRYLLSAALFFL